MTIEERIAAILKRADAATKGPWIAVECGANGADKRQFRYGIDWAVETEAEGIDNPDADEVYWVASDKKVKENAVFATHARTDVPRLCRALEEALYWIDNGVWVQGAQGIRDEIAAILDGKESNDEMG